MSLVWNFCRWGADVFFSRCLYWQGARGDSCFHRLTNIGWISWPWCEFHKHFQPNENSPAIKKSPATQNDGNGCPFLHAAIIAKMKAARWNRRPKTINAITTPFQSENKMALLQVFLRLVFTSNRVQVRIVREVARVLMTLWKSKIKSRKQSHKCNRIEVGRIRMFPISFDISAYDSNIYDLVKNRSSELEAEAEG